MTPRERRCVARLEDGLRMLYSQVCQAYARKAKVGFDPENRNLALERVRRDVREIAVRGSYLAHALEERKIEPLPS